MAASDKPSDESLYPIAVLIDELKNEDIQVSDCHINYTKWRWKEQKKNTLKMAIKLRSWSLYGYSCHKRFWQQAKPIKLCFECGICELKFLCAE